MTRAGTKRQMMYIHVKTTHRGKFFVFCFSENLAHAQKNPPKKKVGAVGGGKQRKFTADQSESV